MHSTERCDDCKNARMVLSENGYHAACTLPLRQAVKCMTGEDKQIIQQLEADALKNCRVIEKLIKRTEKAEETIDFAHKEVLKLTTERNELKSRLAQAERERDALMRDLRDVGTCDGCIHDRDPIIHDSCIACRRCHPNDSDGMFDHWQWRGVCPENTKEE